jgi:hypothetical protein
MRGTEGISYIIGRIAVFEESKFNYETYYNRNALKQREKYRLIEQMRNGDGLKDKLSGCY